MSKQKSVVANAPTTNKAGDKFSGFLAPATKEGSFSSVAIDTNGGKKKK